MPDLPIAPNQAHRFPLIEKAVSEGVSGYSPGPLSLWSQDDLRALIKQCEDFHALEVAYIEKNYGEQVFKPENFLSKARSKRLDDKRRSDMIDAIGRAAELCAAAMLYLPQGEPDA